MKVLGVVGSPRKGGNTDILVDKVLLGAQMKTFIDRWNALLDANYKTKLKGKSAAIIAVCGAPETSMTDFTVQTFEKMFGFIGIELKGKVTTSAREKAEVLNNKSVLEEAFSLGTML